MIKYLKLHGPGRMKIIKEFEKQFKKHKKRYDGLTWEE